MNDEDGSHWHSIRPWSSRFLLTVREITSVSATFLLSSTLSANADTDPSLASLGLVPSSDDEDVLEDAHLISETLGKGLSVTVNAAPWKRVLMHVKDEDDAAIVILYGLMPGRQYDIELGIMSGEEKEIIQSQMTTPAQTRNDQSPSRHQDEPSELTDPASTPNKHKAPTSSNLGSPSITPASSPPRTNTLEERATQLRQQVAQLSTERDGLAAQLKTTRKDAQKADAALRSETDGLRRAAEKYAPAEHRARQKVLALQEAVKQALAASAETEELVREIEDTLPALRERESDVERRHEDVMREGVRSREECEEAVRADRKKVSDMQGELAGLGNRLDKLTGKKEKLANDTIPDLEAQLARLAHDIELVEHDAHGYAIGADESGKPIGFEHQGFTSRHGPRQAPAPIGSQRPTHQQQNGPASSPRPQVRQRTSHPSSSRNTAAGPNSTLPRASPFDPLFRPGHRSFAHPASLDGHPTSAPATTTSIQTPELKASGSGSACAAPRTSTGSTFNNIAVSSTPPYTTSFGSTSSNTASTATPYTHAGKLRPRPSPPQLSATAFNLDVVRPQNAGGRPVSPARQTSLPVIMPSFSQTSQGPHPRQRVTSDDL